MEEVKTETKKTAKKTGMEDIFVPKGRKDEEQNLFISINGVNYLLPKGQKSTVPSFVAAEYRRSQEAQAALDNKKDEMIAASQK